VHLAFANNKEVTSVRATTLLSTILGMKHTRVAAVAFDEEGVVADVERIKSHPLVPPEIPVYGYVYDIKSGRLIEVKQARAAGASRS